MTDDIPDSIDDSADTEACMVAGQEADHVRHCLGTLGDDHRSTITLAFYQDMAYGEIAEVTGVPEGTVKTRIFHAKKLAAALPAGPRPAGGNCMTRDEISALLPFLGNETLTGEERAEVEAAVAEDADLQAEIGCAADDPGDDAGGRELQPRRDRSRPPDARCR